MFSLIRLDSERLLSALRSQCEGISQQRVGWGRRRVGVVEDLLLSGGV